MRPNPKVMPWATIAASSTGMPSVAGIPVTRRTTIAIMNGAGRAAPVKAAMVQPTARPSGTSGKMRLIAVPAAPPTKNRGKMGPPMKPVDIAPAVARILPKTSARTERHAHGCALLGDDDESFRAQEHRQGQRHAEETQEHVRPRRRAQPAGSRDGAASLWSDVPSVDAVEQRQRGADDTRRREPPGGARVSRRIRG